MKKIQDKYLGNDCYAEDITQNFVLNIHTTLLYWNSGIDAADHSFMFFISGTGKTSPIQGHLWFVREAMCVWRYACRVDSGTDFQCVFIVAGRMNWMCTCRYVSHSLKQHIKLHLLSELLYFYFLWRS